MASVGARLRKVLVGRLPMMAMAAAAAGVAGLGAGTGVGVGIAWAERASKAPQKVAEFSSSGFVFKDTVEVTAFPDPKIDGITIHISNVRRSITERMKKSFFTDPSQTSVTCSQTGPLRIAEPIALGMEGEEVFRASKNLLFKTTHVRRVYDSVNNALIYVAYSSRLSQDMQEPNSRYRTSLSSISLYGQNIDPTAGKITTG